MNASKRYESPRQTARGRDFGSSRPQVGYLRKRPRPKYPSTNSTMSTITMIQIKSGIPLSLRDPGGKRPGSAPHGRFRMLVQPRINGQESARR